MVPSSDWSLLMFWSLGNYFSQCYLHLYTKHAVVYHFKIIGYMKNPITEWEGLHKLAHSYHSFHLSHGIWQFWQLVLDLYFPKCFTCFRTLRDRQGFAATSATTIQISHGKAFIQKALPHENEQIHIIERTWKVIICLKSSYVVNQVNRCYSKYVYEILRENTRCLLFFCSRELAV